MTNEQEWVDAEPTTAAEIQAAQFVVAQFAKCGGLSKAEVTLYETAVKFLTLTLTRQVSTEDA